jgi:uncharacterized membrane protein YfcA
MGIQNPTRRLEGRGAPSFHVVACLVIWLAWAWWCTRLDLLGSLAAHWPMTMTMVAGSFIGGATCEGGGAVAFPVLTLIFHVDPAVARNFSFAIQSMGMGMAALVIVTRKIPIERPTVLWASIGGAIGLLFGTAFIAPHVAPKPAKLLFVSIWLSFGIALFLLNRRKDREVFQSIELAGSCDVLKLLAFGVVGGMISSVFGSGLNDLVFCLLTLHFRVSEKVATPTSVVLMAINALLGACLHAFVIHDFNAQAYGYWLASVPVVVVFAPLGAILMSKRSRHFVGGFLYTVIVLQFVGALWVLRPPPRLLAASVAVTTLGVLVFWGMTRWQRSRGPITSSAGQVAEGLVPSAALDDCAPGAKAAPAPPAKPSGPHPGPCYRNSRSTHDDAATRRDAALEGARTALE